MRKLQRVTKSMWIMNSRRYGCVDTAWIMQPFARRSFFSKSNNPGQKRGEPRSKRRRQEGPLACGLGSAVDGSPSLLVQPNGGSHKEEMSMIFREGSSGRPDCTSRYIQKEQESPSISQIPAKILQEALRSLASGGVVLLSVLAARHLQHRS